MYSSLVAEVLQEELREHAWQVRSRAVRALSIF